MQDSRLSVSDFIPGSKLCSHLQDSISSVEDKCYLDSRLSEVVPSDYSSESNTPSPSSHVPVPLVIDDNFNDVCSSLQEVQPCFCSSISSSVGISSQSFVSPDVPLFEPNSFVTLHNLVYAMGRPNFVGVRLSVPTLLNLSLLRSLLTEHSDVVVWDYLEFGWIGYNYHGVRTAMKIGLFLTSVGQPVRLLMMEFIKISFWVNLYGGPLTP